MINENSHSLYCIRFSGKKIFISPKFMDWYFKKILFFFSISYQDMVTGKGKNHFCVIANTTDTLIGETGDCDKWIFNMWL